MIRKNREITLCCRNSCRIFCFESRVHSNYKKDKWLGVFDWTDICVLVAVYFFPLKYDKAGILSGGLLLLFVGLKLNCNEGSWLRDHSSYIIEVSEKDFEKKQRKDIIM